jgi:GT2 family glycosyltransferase
MENEIYILIPIHNRKLITLSFIENLKNQTYPNFRLVLIDDGSTDGTSEAVLHQLPNSIILKANGKLWWAGSLQMAINHFKKNNFHPETPILIINDDTVIPDNFLEIGFKELSSGGKSVICASSNLDGKITRSGVNINWLHFGFIGTEDDNLVNCLPTRGIFLRFGDVLNIGEFRPLLLPHYLSDYEFTYRAYVKGYKLMCPLNLYLTPMLNESGIRFFDHKKGFAYLRILFSKKCVTNPFYLTIFILIASPMKYKIRNLYDLYLMTAKGIIKSFVL